MVIIGCKDRPIDDESITLIFWPEVITNPDFEYTDEHIKAQAIADGLEAWALCYLAKRPENFGYGMIKIAKAAELDIATQENLMKASENLSFEPVGEPK